jgi:uncharacterized caspase-like protein
MAVATLGLATPALVQAATSELSYKIKNALINAAENIGTQVSNSTELTIFASNKTSIRPTQIHAQSEGILKGDTFNMKPIVQDKNEISSHVKKANNLSDRNSTKWAVVIGVSEYQDTRIPSLRHGYDDAKSFYNWLISPTGGRFAPSRVKLLLGQDATGKSMKHALFVWLKKALEEDMVIIYFAGHGSSESPDSTDNLFLLPYDAQYDDIATTAFPMWDMETALKRFIKAKKVVIIADACHGGGVGQPFDVVRRTNRAIQVSPISSGLQDLSAMGDGICVISASDSKQFSQEGKNWGGGHGVFTYYLLRGLRGESDYNRDDRVTLGELIPYLSEHVRRATGNAQSPTVAGRFDPALSIGR